MFGFFKKLGEKLHQSIINDFLIEGETCIKFVPDCGKPAMGQNLILTDRRIALCRATGKNVMYLGSISGVQINTGVPFSTLTVSDNGGNTIVFETMSPQDAEDCQFLIQKAIVRS